MGTIKSVVLIAALSTLFICAARATEFNDISFRTDGGSLLTKGMAKAEVAARFRQPDEKDVLTHGSKCRIKVEVWNYYLGSQVLIITFTGNAVSNIKLIQL
jgi:hypothetical protein